MGVKWLGLGLVLLVAGSCRLGGGAEVRFDAAPGALRAPAVDPRTVALLARGELPDGLLSVPRAPLYYLAVKVEPDFPTREAPHRILGSVTAPRRGRSDAEVARQLAVEAAARGANALVIVLASPERVAAVAVRLSDAAPPASFPSAGELLAQQPKLPHPAEAGERFVQRLEAPTPIEFTARAGTCYAFHAALDAGARLSSRARGQLVFVYQGGGASSLDSALAGALLGQQIRHAQRAFTGLFACAEVDTPVRVVLASGADADDHSLGTGELHVQLYTWTLSEAEILARKVERSRAAQRRADAARRAPCRACAPALARCPTSGACEEYRECLFRSGVRVDDCQ